MALILMCGLSFAGKSTLARAIADRLGTEVLSLDGINAERGLDSGQGIPVEEWAETNRIAHGRAESRLRDGQDVVVDDTGSPRFVRDAWRATAQAGDASFHLVWIRIDAALQRERVLASRSAGDRPDVVDAVLAEHRASFEEPAGEGAIEVDARATLDPAEVDRIVTAIRS